MNVNDLAFFNSLQKLVYQTCPSTVDELITNTLTCYANYPYSKVNDGFLTHQVCMNEIMELHGSNQYKIPHMNKRKLERLGQLPVSIRAVRNPFEDDNSDDGDDADENSEENDEN
jgi:hypothetical protein